MGRIRSAYVCKFRDAIQRLHARRLDQGTGWLMRRAGQLQGRLGLGESEALETVWQSLCARLARWMAAHDPPRFFCDAGLGGLARWLRAAGYEALWEADIDDGDLLRAAAAAQCWIVTADSGLLERRLLRDRVIPWIWVSPVLKPQRQLTSVLGELRLELRGPRCMHCGGSLDPVDKEAVWERIPPRTYRWLDEYFLCAGCGQLFWRGTHWQRIRERLRASVTAPPPSPTA